MNLLVHDIEDRRSLSKPELSIPQQLRIGQSEFLINNICRWVEVVCGDIGWEGCLTFLELREATNPRSATDLREFIRTLSVESELSDLH